MERKAFLLEEGAWQGTLEAAWFWPGRESCMPDNFTQVNGREVFDNGLTRRWRCPSCKWWQEWDKERCSCCGALRDKGSQQATKERPAASNPR